MQINALEIHEKLVRLGTEWAHRKEAADLLEAARKPLLAKLASESNEKSFNAREAYALAHDDYQEHCRKLAEATREEAIAKVKYQAANSYTELLRTIAANERAAMREAT